MHSNNVSANLLSNPIVSIILGAATGALGAAVVTLITPTAPVSVPAAAVVFGIASAIEFLARPVFGKVLSYVGGLFAGHALARSIGYSLAGRAIVPVAIAQLSLGLAFGVAGFCCFASVIAAADLK